MKKIHRKKLSKRTLNAIKLIAKEGLLPSLTKPPAKVEKPISDKKVSKPLKPTLVYPEELNPFQSALSKIRLDEGENMILSAFLEKVVSAKNVDELSKIVDEGLYSGIRINAPNEDGFTFSNVTIFKICHDKFTGNKREDIIRRLALSGAEFDEPGDEKTTAICKKVQKEVEPQVYDRLKQLREVAESATVVGAVEGVEIDNKTFFIEFSPNSAVEVATVIEGAKRLGLSRGNLDLGGNILKIGDGALEVKTGKNGERNYVDILDNSTFTVMFPSSLGQLKIIICHDPQKYNQVQVEVEDKKMWGELQKIGEIVGQGCLFGGMSVREAVEKGSFIRSENQRPELQSREIVSWVDRTKNITPAERVRA